MGYQGGCYVREGEKEESFSTTSISSWTHATNISRLASWVFNARVSSSWNDDATSRIPHATSNSSKLSPAWSAATLYGSYGAPAAHERALPARASASYDQSTYIDNSSCTGPSSPHLLQLPLRSQTCRFECTFDSSTRPPPRSGSFFHGSAWFFDNSNGRPNGSTRHSNKPSECASTSSDSFIYSTSRRRSEADSTFDNSTHSFR